MPRAPGHLPMLALWLLAAALGLRLTLVVSRSATEPAHGFVAHFAASRIALERADAAALYDDERFIAAVQTYEPGVVDIFGANPPTVALAALPLAALDYRQARVVWTLASLLAWLLAILWLAKVLAIDGPWLPALLGVAAVFQPTVENLRHGQFHVLVLCLVLVAWHGIRRERPAAVGAGLGPALALKAAGALFWPLLLARRRWRPLAVAAGAAAAFVVLSLLLPGADAWAAFIDRAGDTVTSASLSVTAYQTVPGLVRRLTVADPQWNPSPLLDLGSAGIALSWVVVATLLGYSLIAARRNTESDSFAAFAALGLALSPVSLDYHYVLAIFPAAVLLARYRARLFAPSGMLLLGAVAAITLDLPYRSAALADGGLALLAYPKLYGALILWWLVLRGPGQGAGTGAGPDVR